MLMLFHAAFLKKGLRSVVGAMMMSILSTPIFAAEGILDYDAFRRDIEPMLSTTTYASPGPTPMSCFDCHGISTHAAFSAYSLIEGNSRHNFTETAARLSISDPDTSLILLKPLALAAGGVPHGLVANEGGSQFPDTMDENYVTILNWIYAATLANQGARISRAEPHPNPFRYTCDIVYFLTTTAQDVTVTLYTTSGFSVRTFEGSALVGANKVTWDGRDADLEPMPTGVYFYRVKAEFDDDTVTKTGSLVYMP